jgi:hypothetical protein
MSTARGAPWIRTVSSCILAAALACGGGGSSPGGGPGPGPSPSVGAIHVHAVTPASVTLDHVMATVTGADLATPISARLAPEGTGWTGTVGAVPAGGGRTVVVEAFDAGNSVQYRGSATGVTVAADGVVPLTIVAQPVNPPAAGGPPLIDAIAGSTLTVAAGGTVNVSVTAHGTDAGSVLSYQWSAAAGAFSNPAAAATTWTAPGTGGPQTLTVTVTDANGSATATLDVSVKPPPQAAPACEGNFVGPDPMAGLFFCTTTYSAGPTADLSRTAFFFTNRGTASATDGRPPRIVFKAVPAAGTTYALSDLASFSSWVWWQKGTDIYVYVAAVNALALTSIGSGSVTVTSVAPLASGGSEIHGSVDVTLVPHAATIGTLDPRFDDPLAKLPADIGGSIHLQGTF